MAREELDAPRPRSSRSTSPMFLPRQVHRQRLGVEARAVADLAGHLHVGQEAHLDGAARPGLRRPAQRPSPVLNEKRPGAVAARPRLHACRRTACGWCPRSRCRWPGRSAASCRSASGPPRARGRSAASPCSGRRSPTSRIAPSCDRARRPRGSRGSRAARRAPASTCPSPTRRSRPRAAPAGSARRCPEVVQFRAARPSIAGVPSARSPRRGCSGWRSGAFEEAPGHRLGVRRCSSSASPAPTMCPPRAPGARARGR